LGPSSHTFLFSLASKSGSEFLYIFFFSCIKKWFWVPLWLLSLLERLGILLMSFEHNHSKSTTEEDWVFCLLHINLVFHCHPEE
jgi:hypothetical protein